MIVGKLVDLYRYKGIAKNVDTAIDWMLGLGVEGMLALPKGKTVVDGTNVYANRDTYVAKKYADTFFENHENYIDIQVVLKGSEKIGYTHISNPDLKVTVPYNPEKDVTKYNNDPKGAVFFDVEEGFALVYTEDAHLAKCRTNDEDDTAIVEKLVVKIKIEK